jgi:hypothetical protein
MRENRLSGSEGGGAETNCLSLPLFRILHIVSTLMGFGEPSCSFVPRRPTMKRSTKMSLVRFVSLSVLITSVTVDGYAVLLKSRY